MSGLGSTVNEAQVCTGLVEGDMNAFEALRSAGIVGVLRAQDAASAIEKARTAMEAGLEAVEVTFTVPDAVKVIERLVREFPHSTVGAGTVLDSSQVEEAVAAGARFIVSPHLSEEVEKRAAELDVPYVPGAMTPTEVFRASSNGARLVKVFPIARLGGPAYVRDLLGPYPNLEIMVTGGVSLSQVGEYRRAGAVSVGLGSVFSASASEIRSALEAV